MTDFTENSQLIEDIMGFNPQQLDIFNEQDSTNYDENVYKTKPATSKAEDGHYRSRIRVIYNPFNIKDSVVKQATYAMTDQNGFFMVKSKLANGDKSCPLFVNWKKLHFSTDETKFEVNGQMYTKKTWGDEMYDKTESQWVLVQILEDDNQPELVGKFKVMKLPKAIFVKMNAKMNPAPESKKAPIAVMDYLIGLPLDMDVTPGPDDPKNPSRKQREISYDLCEFDTDYTPIIGVDGKPLFDESELELIDTYKTAQDDFAKAKTQKKKDEAQEKVKEVYDGIKALYVKALKYVKENAINLEDECAFKEWDEKTTERVMSWINTVAALRDPKDGPIPTVKESMATAVASSAEETKTESPTENMMNPMADAADETDLPF